MTWQFPCTKHCAHLWGFPLQGIQLRILSSILQIIPSLYYLGDDSALTWVLTSTSAKNGRVCRNRHRLETVWRQSKLLALWWPCLERFRYCRRIHAVSWTLSPPTQNVLILIPGQKIENWKQLQKLRVELIASPLDQTLEFVRIHDLPIVSLEWTCTHSNTAAHQHWQRRHPHYVKTRDYPIHEFLFTLNLSWRTEPNTW
jgi:hypothetical protein